MSLGCARRLVCVGVWWWGASVLAAAEQSIGKPEYYLGTAGLPQWTEYAGREPHGRQLDLDFDATPESRDSTLLLRQAGVSEGWDVVLNGRRLGGLERLEEPLVLGLGIPAGLLRHTGNRLSILPPKSNDDILVGDIRLDPRPREEAMTGATLTVDVRDAVGEIIPCRITIADTSGALALVRVAPAPGLAVRPGVIYTGGGSVRMALRPGTYTVYAGRGMEYGAPSAEVKIEPGATERVGLVLRREVPTPGWVAADAHIHTLTHSRHGDATVAERMVTIAGEGIELAVATDHNHHADFSEPARAAGLAGRFTSVVGNEVTTAQGHFNAFPVVPGSHLPDHKIGEWVPLLKNIRSATGARVIVLNHPRDAHSRFTPFGPTNFDPVVGEMYEAPKFDCDAVEVITSAALQSDVMVLYRDWFALLNFGLRLAAVGSSDTHDVTRFILGQARTYVACNDARPEAIDIDEVCASYREGRLLVSLGLLTNMTVARRFRVGDLAVRLDAEFEVAVDVSGPSWVAADTVELFANGIKVREQRIEPSVAVLKARVVWKLARPAHDVHLVAIATGPGVTAPYWPVPRPQQPTSNVFNPRVIGSTNPIWIDGDGDGKFTPARTYANDICRTAGLAPAEIVLSLARFDAAVAAQAASVCERNGVGITSEAFVAALAKAPPQVHDGIRSYLSVKSRPTR